MVESKVFTCDFCRGHEPELDRFANLPRGWVNLFISTKENIGCSYKQFHACSLECAEELMKNLVNIKSNIKEIHNVR